jgi:uncharacterized membrane protein
LVDELYDERLEASAEAPDVVLAPNSRVVFRIDNERLVHAASAADGTLVMVPALGDFVPAGAPLFRVLGDPVRLDQSRVVGAVVLGPERTLNQDVAYGFRMLVDIAVRALSDALPDDGGAGDRPPPRLPASVGPAPVPDRRVP